MEKWEWTDNFWKGRKRHAGEDVDFSDPKVGPFKAQLINEERIIRKKTGGERKKVEIKREGDN